MPTLHAISHQTYLCLDSSFTCDKLVRNHKVIANCGLAHSTGGGGGRCSERWPPSSKQRLQFSCTIHGLVHTTDILLHVIWFWPNWGSNFHRCTYLSNLHNCPIYCLASKLMPSVFYSDKNGQFCKILCKLMQSPNSFSLIYTNRDWIRFNYHLNLEITLPKKVSYFLIFSKQFWTL